ncbi:hypothetical protein ACFLZS_00205 [Patescibacteria group bacterium]
MDDSAKVQRKETRRSIWKGIRIGTGIGALIGIPFGALLTLILVIFLAVSGTAFYYIGFEPETLKILVEDELYPLTKYEDMEVVGFIPIEDEGTGAGCFLIKKEDGKDTDHTTLLALEGSIIYPDEPKSGDIIESVLFDNRENRYIIELGKKKPKEVTEEIAEVEEPEATETKKEIPVPATSEPVKKTPTTTLTKRRSAESFTEGEMEGATTN